MVGGGPVSVAPVFAVASGIQTWRTVSKRAMSSVVSLAEKLAAE